MKTLKDVILENFSTSEKLAITFLDKKLSKNEKEQTTIVIERNEIKSFLNNNPRRINKDDTNIIIKQIETLKRGNCYFLETHNKEEFNILVTAF